MKLSYRIVFINFIIVLIVLGSSSVVFYSLMYSALTSQQSQSLLSSSNIFIYSYRNLLEDSEAEYATIKEKGLNRIFYSRSLEGYVNDFVLEAVGPGQKIIDYAAKPFIGLPKTGFSIKEFFELNPYAVVKQEAAGDKTIYYGKVFNSDLLADLSKRIGSEIAIVWDDLTTEVSNPNSNKQYIYILNQAYNYLSLKSESNIFTEGAEASDIIATIYRPYNSKEITNNLSFLIFRAHGEAADLRDTLKTIFLIIGLVGLIIALILTYLLTHKLRDQLTDLSHATQSIRTGNFNTRIQVRSKDEVGKLGEAFNVMVTELEKNQKAKNEYSEFITLINKNPTLSEISEAALNKISNTYNFVLGALYSIDNDNITLIHSDGVVNENSLKQRNEIYQKLISKKEAIEISSQDYLPVVTTGTLQFKVRYLLLIPIIYNQKVIAILELGSVNKPTDEAKKYLQSIQEQLAIGLTNAKTFVQLENFVTELKKLNEEYQNQNLMITKQNEKLIQLHNELKTKAEELELQKIKAEESTRLKSEFLASMSHELRTPMNSILGLTELILEKSRLDNKNMERLEVVHSSGKRLMRLINDILDLSKIESGKMEIVEEDFLLDEVIEEVLQSMAPLAYDKGLNFRVNRKCNTRVVINTDKGRVTQVLINLVGNAIKFTEKGIVELVINLIGNNNFEFSVIDSGIGISSNDKKVIFEEFRQLDGTSTRKYGGTGLGLAICKKIVDLLGGSLSVESTLGKGSIFTFMLPIKYSYETRNSFSQRINLNLVDHDDDNNEEKVRDLTTATEVIVVDDDPDTLFTINEIVQSLGINTHTANSGVECLRLLENIKPDLILLDIMMPVMDGFQTLRNIRAKAGFEEIPVFAVTAKAMAGDKEIILRNGFTDYISKPVNASLIAQKIAKYFTKTKTV